MSEDKKLDASLASIHDRLEDLERLITMVVAHAVGRSAAENLDNSFELMERRVRDAEDWKPREKRS